MMSLFSPRFQAVDPYPLPPLSISPSLLPYSAAQAAAFTEHSPGSAPSSPIKHEPVSKTEDGLDDRDLDFPFPFPFCPSSPHADDALQAAQSAPSPSTSLSPPYSLASVSSPSSSVSSRSSSPCLAACSCCLVARRLSALVPALKKKTRHTASLVSLYQSTVASLQSTQQQLSRAQQQEQPVREEVERLRVAVAGKDSHIAQLKATVSKLQVEKDDRELRDRSVKELQREHDGLVRRCEKLRESLELMQRRKEEREREEREEQQRKRAAAAAAEEIDWQEEEQPPQQQQPIIIELPQHEQQQPSAASASSSSSSSSSSVSSALSSGAGGDTFDIARTMALAEAAMNALREELKKRNALVKKLMAERKEWRRRKAAEESAAVSVSSSMSAAGLTLQEMDRKRMRRGSTGELNMKQEELDEFAAEVQQALTAGESREGEEQQHQKLQPAADHPEAETESVALRSAVVMADVQGAVESEQQPEKRKRGRPRIHPIKVKKTAASRQRARESAAQPEETTATQAQPSAAPPVKPEPDIASEPQHVSHHPRTPRASSVAAQQLEALLQGFTTELASSASAVSAASPQAAGKRQEAMDDVVCRMLALLCPCPCLSQSLPSLASAAASLPPILMAPVVPTSPAVFAIAAQCSRCSSPTAFSPLASCCDGSGLRWDEMLSSFLARAVSSELTEGQSSTDAAQPYLELLLTLESRLQQRWSQAAAQGDAAALPSFPLLSLFCHLATHRLLSSTAASSSLLQVETALLLLAAQRAGDSAAVRVLLHQRCLVSLPSLPFAELVASICPQLLRPSPPSQQSSSLHIKTVRLVLASMLASLPAAADAVVTSSPASSPPYPALASLLSAELSSLKAASQPFVFSRLQSELTMHAALTAFASQAHFLAIAASVLSSFHLLFLFLSPLPLALSVAQKQIIPALATARSPANAALLLLTLPSLLSLAVAQLRSSAPSASAASRSDVAALKAAVASLLTTAADAVDGRHGQAVEVRAAGVELLLRSMREAAWEGGAGSGRGSRGRPVQVVKKEEKERLRRLVDGWLAALGEVDAAVIAGSPLQAGGVQLWELLSSVRAAVSTTRRAQLS